MWCKWIAWQRRGLVYRRLPWLRLALRLLVLLGVMGSLTPQPIRAADPLPPLIFVARSHLATQDDIFEDEVGPAGQFGTGIPKFAPGSKLVRRNGDGSLFVYSTPGLVDLQSPDVNFAGTKIVFAGATTLLPDTNDSGWRLYEINVDGSGFRQLTHSDRAITIPYAARFLNQRTYGTYNDLFPAYLADGRIVFASSRYPARAHYDDRRSYNLYVMDADGGNLHRITSERGGMLHPTPLPDGRILATRWWVNFNQPTETGIFNRIDNAEQAHTLADGTFLQANPDETFNPTTGKLADGFAIRNAPNTWHLMALNPDGTHLQRFAWTPLAEWSLTIDSGSSDTYHAAQPAIIQQGDELFVAYTSQQDATMVHSTLKTGIRVARPGIAMLYANAQDAIAGLTYEKAWQQEDESPPYALHPWGLPDGRILYSQTVAENSLPTSGQHSEGGTVFPLQGSTLRYTLYTMALDGSNKTPVPLDLGAINMVTADAMDAKPIVVRTGWSTLPDTFTAVASDDPHEGNLPNTLPGYAFSQHGPHEIETAVVHNPNIYANPGLDLPYVNNSPPPGSVAKVQLWVDANQFTGAYCYDDYPEPCADFRHDSEVRAVLWGEAPVTAAGAFTITVPADTPAFFVLHDAQGRVVRNWSRGYISIAQGNAWARPGETVTCTGCHMGHVSGSLAASAVADSWTNIAPYATVNVSNYYAYRDPDAPGYQPFRPHYLTDRRGWTPTPAGGPPAPFIEPEAAFARYRRLLSALDLPPTGLDQRQPVQAAVTYQDQASSWLTEEGKAVGEWVELRWPKPLLIKSIRLIGVPPTGGDWAGFGEPAEMGPYAIATGTLQLFREGVQQGDDLAVGRVEPLATGGTLITLAEPMQLDRVRFTVASITGRWWWQEVAALSEIEVMGMATQVNAPLPEEALTEKTFLPTVVR